MVTPFDLLLFKVTAVTKTTRAHTFLLVPVVVRALTSSHLHHRHNTCYLLKEAERYWRHIHGVGCYHCKESMHVSQKSFVTRQLILPLLLSDQTFHVHTQVTFYLVQKLCRPILFVMFTDSLNI